MSKFLKNINSASLVLTRPRVTEKATFLASAGNGVYTFEISDKANKISVARAIREFFKVTPVRVNIINTRPKIVFRRGKKGVVQGIKKAMVYLKKGDKIEMV